MNPTKTIIIGGGPAGLTAGYELAKNGHQVSVLEKSRFLGGIARTESYKGYRFDIGGHRFYTKIKEVEAVWHDLLGDDLLDRPRMSRIFYQGKFYDYPLKPLNTLSNLGIWTSISVGLSYLRSLVFPYPQEDNFEEWVSNRFGRKLYKLFFKTYTEKVWGIPCNEIHSEWAAQRIKGLSLPVAVRNALFRYPDGEVKTLINHFQYPRLGPGMMWEVAGTYIEERNGEVLLEKPVEKVWHQDGRVTHVTTNGSNSSQPESFEGSNFISTMPIPELIRRLEPAPPPEILAAAEQLTFRDFLTVILIVKQADLFPDNWIYIHEPQVSVGRIQNFKNWSPEMVPDLSTSALGLEYFCNEGDELWAMDDQALIKLGTMELGEIGLVDAADVIDGVVVRQPKAYPVYTRTYGEFLNQIHEYLLTFENLQTIGRNGLHKYNNQDHSMLTALLAARNIMGEEHDVWDVNTERSYHEEIKIPHDALSADEAGIR